MKGWKSSADSQIAGYYDLQETIGRGHFAVVKRAKHVFTGEVVATKVVDKTKLDEISRQHLYHEVRCMKLVQHPYVVRLYEVIDTKNKLYLIQEFGDGGDLFDYICKKDNGLGEAVARKYFRQIVSAVAFCHRLHVVHRDLKPENVIFFPKLDVVKVTDFGFSNSFKPGDKLNTACGSLAYSAPEVLLGDAYDAVASDIWSLGVILYMLVVGRLPFSEANDSETLTKIMDCQYSIPKSLSPECQKLVKKLLVKEPQDRISIDDILTDPWFGSAFDEDSDIVGVHPLLSRGELSEEEREHIIGIMVSGNVATREEILKSLESNCYDHIEATFYLLAERHLAAMLAHRVGRFGPSQVHSRNFSASNSAGSVFSAGAGKTASDDNLINEGTSSTRKNETMSAISESEGALEEDDNEEETRSRFSVLIEEPYEDPDELPQIYEIREGVDDLELEFRKASLTRLANIAEQSESDEAASSHGRPSGRLSVGAGPSDSGPENVVELGSPSVRPRSARSSWIGPSSSRRSSGHNLRSGSLGGRPPSLSRVSAPSSVSPFCRLTRSASSSDTSDIESDAMSMSMNRSIARMKRGGAYNGKPRGACFRCDKDFPGSLAASLLLSANEPHSHRRPLRHKKNVGHRPGGLESSEAATTSASDTEQPFSSATSRCQSAAASVSFILGAVASEQQTLNAGHQTLNSSENNMRRSSLPQSDAADMKACCAKALDARISYVTPVLERVPFDQQKLPRSYRHALQMRLRHHRHHGNHKSKPSSSHVFLPVSHALLTGRHSANLVESSSESKPLSSRKSVPPRIDELSPSPNGQSKEPKVEVSREVIPSPTTNSANHIPNPQPVIPKALANVTLPLVTEKQPDNQNSERRNSAKIENGPALMGHASAPASAILSSASNRRHHNTELRPFNQLHLLKGQHMSEFSVSTSRETGSECSLPASSAPSIRNGFKTPSVSSVRSDPDLLYYRSNYNHNNPNIHCSSTVSAVVGGSCRTSRMTSRTADRKRSGEDGEALLGESNKDQQDAMGAPIAAPCVRCGSLQHDRRKRGGSSSSYRSAGAIANHCRAPSSGGRAPSIRSNHSETMQTNSNGGQRLSLDGAVGSVSSTAVAGRHNKRNLLRSLFGQCFGCSLNNQSGSTSVQSARKTRRKAAAKDSNRKKIDSSGLA